MELTWSENAAHAVVIKKLIVLLRNNTSDDENFVICADLLQLLHKFRDKRFVSGGLGGYTNNMNIGINGLASHFSWCLKQTDIRGYSFHWPYRKLTWKRGPISTSKPRSANPDAITLAPRS
jgi:hypothetical protein